MIKISPSLLASDFTRLDREIPLMESAGADMLHLDVMDGHFVPNITFGPPVISAIKKITGLCLDVHLMITNPFDYIDVFAMYSDILTFHIESDSNAAATIKAIKEKNVKCGIALKPKTPASAVIPFLPLLDMVLVMTVEPGFGGQSFMKDMLTKVRELRKAADELNPGLDIQVDGGIDFSTAPLAAGAGANVLVAGTSLFSSSDYAQAISRMRQADVATDR